MRIKMAARKKNSTYKLDENHQCSRFLIYFIGLSVFFPFETGTMLVHFNGHAFAFSFALTSKWIDSSIWFSGNSIPDKDQRLLAVVDVVLFLQYLFLLYALLLLLELSCMRSRTPSRTAQNNTLHFMRISRWTAKYFVCARENSIQIESSDKMKLRRIHKTKRMSSASARTRIPHGNVKRTKPVNSIRNWMEVLFQMETMCQVLIVWCLYCYDSYFILFQFICLAFKVVSGNLCTVNVKVKFIVHWTEIFEQFPNEIRSAQTSRRVENVETWRKYHKNALWLERTFPRINGDYVADLLMVYWSGLTFWTLSRVLILFGDELSTEISTDAENDALNHRSQSTMINECAD